MTTIEETDESEDEDSGVKVRSTGLSRESRSQSLKRKKGPKRDSSKGDKLEPEDGAIKRSSSLKLKSEKEEMTSQRKDISPDPTPLQKPRNEKKSKGGLYSHWFFSISQIFYFES